MCGKGWGCKFGVVDEESDADGCCAGLCGVIDFEAFPVAGGEHGGIKGAEDGAVEKACGELAPGLGGDGVDEVDCLADVESGLG